jgi:hypothetical protein
MRNALLAAAAAAAGLGLGVATTLVAQPAADPRLGALLDERAIIAAADAIDHLVDVGDWRGAEALFAPRVRVDFTAFGAPAPAELSAAELVGGWQRSRGTVKTAFHIRGNHLVRIDADRAVMTSHGYAWNRMPAWAPGQDLAEVWGIYEHRLLRTAGGWRVDGFAFRPLHVRGNAEVFSHVPN